MYQFVKKRVDDRLKTPPSCYENQSHKYALQENWWWLNTEFVAHKLVAYYLKSSNILTFDLLMTGRII